MAKAKKTAGRAKKAPTSPRKPKKEFREIAGHKLEFFAPVWPEGAKAYHPRKFGQISGLGQFSCRIWLFQINEGRHAARQAGKRGIPAPLTDSELADIMEAEFPPSEGFGNQRLVSAARRDYNSGRLTSNKPPEQASFAYSEKGERLAGQRGGPSEAS